MRRSFLSSSSYRLLSHLGPALRRHGRSGSVVHIGGGGGATRAMSRGYYSDWSDYDDYPYGSYSDPNGNDFDTDDSSEPEANFEESGCRPNSLMPLLQRRQLYLAFDDWSKGFSLYKLDLDGGNGAMGSQQQVNQDRRLPAPAMRLELPSKYAAGPLLSIGSKIIACTEAEHGIAVIYNTETGAQTMARCHPNVLYYNKWQAAMVEDDTLYTFVSGDTGLYNKSSSSGPQQLGIGGMFCLEDLSKLGRSINELTWKTDSFPLPFNLKHGCGMVTSYAVHPKEKAIFVSVFNDGTYSYNTKRFEWTRHGTWMLPFTGQAHYDDELEAWVGHSQEEGVWKIGCCDVLAPLPRGNPAPPSWKLCEEKISSVKSCLDFDLINMGGGWFFLVESLPTKGLEHKDSVVDDNECELHITLFRGKYDKNGGLKIKDHQHMCSYVFSRYSRYPFQMKAFLM